MWFDSTPAAIFFNLNARHEHQMRLPALLTLTCLLAACGRSDGIAPTQDYAFKPRHALTNAELTELFAHWGGTGPIIQESTWRTMSTELQSEFQRVVPKSTENQ